MSYPPYTMRSDGGTVWFSPVGDGRTVMRREVSTAGSVLGALVGLVVMLVFAGPGGPGGTLASSAGLATWAALGARAIIKATSAPRAIGPNCVIRTAGVQSRTGQGPYRSVRGVKSGPSEDGRAGPHPSRGWYPAASPIPPRQARGRAGRSESRLYANQPT
jgi:hypothetical protein